MDRKGIKPILPKLLATLLAAVSCGCSDRGNGARDAAELMARHFTEQRLAEAYEKSATSFRFTRTANYFEARVRDLGLCEARGVTWGEPQQSGRLSTVRGVFTLKDGTRLPLNFTFNMEDGGWRLIEANADPLPGATKGEDVFAVMLRSRDTRDAKAMEIEEPSAPDIPAEPQLRQLAEDTLMLFNEAVQNGGDFSALFAAASNRWKFRGRDPKEIAYLGSDPELRRRADPENNDRRLTSTAFRNAFASAVETKVDLSAIRGKKMILSSPARVNSDGVLALSGTFDAPVFLTTGNGQPRKLDFHLEYVLEAGAWKLFGITVNIIAPDRQLSARP